MEGIMNSPLSYDELRERHADLTRDVYHLFQAENECGCDTSDFALFDIIEEMKMLMDAGIRRVGLFGEKPNPTAVPFSLRLEFNRRTAHCLFQMQSEKIKLQGKMGF